MAGLCCLCSVSWAQTTNEQFCEALDITSDCPTFSTSDDSSAPWLVSTRTSAGTGSKPLRDATGGKALRSGMAGDSERSCLSVTLQRPVRVAFRWRVSSERFGDYLHYIDDGQRDPPLPFPLKGDKFLSGFLDESWRDASFDYSGSGDIDIEWCYIKDMNITLLNSDDAGYLDRLQITSLLTADVVVSPSQVRLTEGGSATFTISLDETPQSNVAVNLVVPEESMGDIAVSSTQVILSPGQPTMTATITVREDDETEVGETHVVRAQSPVAAATVITVIIPPEPLPQASLCAALDISEGCPTFSISEDSSATWSAKAVGGSSIGGDALLSGMIDHSQRSCLSVTLQRPVRVAFRWRVSSEARFDRLRYIDDGQRSRATPDVATGAKFLSGDLAWRDASFDYFDRGPIDIEWCYIKDEGGSLRDDAGYLDRLQITQLPSGLIALPSQVELSEGGSATFTLSLDETPQSNVAVSLTVPTESSSDITVSPEQVTLSPGQPTMTVTIRAIEDGNAEGRETHVVQAQSSDFGIVRITVITSPDPLLQTQLCAALDVNEEDCPAFSFPNDNSAPWSLSADSDAIGGTALRSGMVGLNQRSCLSATLQRPVRVAFRWRVSSIGLDYLHYIDDGRRNPIVSADPMTGLGFATGTKFLSGDVAWRDASFDYLGGGDIDIEWCYIKKSRSSAGDDAGFLDRLRVVEPLNLIIMPSQVLLPEGSSVAFTLSLDMIPQSNVTVSLTVPAESSGDITVSPAQVILSPGQPTMTATIRAIEDDNAEERETHVVRALGPITGSAAVTVITPLEPLPTQASLCAALDLNEGGCPEFSSSDDSLAFWSASTATGAAGGVALRSGMIGDSQRSCLRATLQGPVRLSFRWRVSSQEGGDYLRYIDDGRRNPALPVDATGARFLSGDAAWRDASFDYPDSGPIDIEWCHIKNGSGSAGDDAGYLDRLRIIPLDDSIIVTPSRVELPEGSSATITLSLDETPQFNVTVKLTVPEESISDIAVSPIQAVLSPDRPSIAIAVSAIKDDNEETRETHVILARSPIAASTMITVITPPDPTLRALLCAALDLDEKDCPTLSTSDDSPSIWSASAVSGATRGTALRSGTVGDGQRSCLRATLQRPARVAFRWRVSSQAIFDYLHYIDDGRRNPVTGSVATGDKFLSGDVAWRDASFEYFGNGPVDIEWCYIKDGAIAGGEDAGYLDRLRITQLNEVAAAPPQVLLPEGSSATITLSLDEALESDVTVKLTVPAESANDIAVSPAQVILSAGQSTAPIAVTAIEDSNAEPRETHVVRLRGPTAAPTVITVITSPDPLPQAPLCAALDIGEKDCPTLSTSDGSSAVWSVVTDNDAIGGAALRSGAVSDNQRSCLSATLQQQRPVRVSFRWRVSSQEGADHLRYIDDGRRGPVTGGVATGDSFLSGDVAWRDASFDYLGDGPVDIEWCHIKDGSGAGGDDAGFLDRLRIAELLGSLTVAPSQVLLPEGGSAALTLSLDMALESDATVKLTVPTESAGDIIVSPAQVVLSAGQSTAPITVAAIEDDDAEARETHTVNARSPVALSTMITVITSPDPLPQDSLCAALDIAEGCPTLSTGDDSPAIWSPSTVSGAIGGVALRSGAIDHNQRSCLRAAIQGPASVSFRWRVSSQQRADYLHYIDDGRLPLARPTAATGAKFLSGNVESWRDASFEYPESGPIDIQWCYIKNGSGVSGDDAGFLDQLRITRPSSSLNLKVRVYLEGALQ